MSIPLWRNKRYISNQISRVPCTSVRGLHEVVIFYPFVQFRSLLQDFFFLFSNSSVSRNWKYQNCFAGSICANTWRIFAKSWKWVRREVEFKASQTIWKKKRSRNIRTRRYYFSLSCIPNYKNATRMPRFRQVPWTFTMTFIDGVWRKSLTYWNQEGVDWKRVSCHGNEMFYSLRCVFYRNISLPSFKDLRCKLAKIALFT